MGEPQTEEEGSRKPTPGAKKRSNHPEKKSGKRYEETAHVIPQRGVRSAALQYLSTYGDRLSVMELTLKTAFHDKSEQW